MSNATIIEENWFLMWSFFWSKSLGGEDFVWGGDLWKTKLWLSRIDENGRKKYIVEKNFVTIVTHLKSMSGWWSNLGEELSWKYWKNTDFHGLRNLFPILVITITIYWEKLLHIYFTQQLKNLSYFRSSHNEIMNSPQGPSLARTFSLSRHDSLPHAHRNTPSKDNDDAVAVRIPAHEYSSFVAVCISLG